MMPERQTEREKPRECDETERETLRDKKQTERDLKKKRQSKKEADSKKQGVEKEQRKAGQKHRDRREMSLLTNAVEGNVSPELI